MAEKQTPRWVRALGLLVWPARGILSTGRMVAHVLTAVVGISLATMTPWAKADPYHGALAIAALLALSGYVAVISLLKRVDDLAKVRTRVVITHAEVREYFVTRRLLESFRDISSMVVETGEPFPLNDALLVPFAINLRNDGEATRVFVPEITLWRRRFLKRVAVPLRQEYVSMGGAITGAEQPDCERWIPTKQYLLPAREMCEVGIVLLATVRDDAEVYRSRPEFRVTIDILGSGERVLRVPLAGVRRAYPRPARPPEGPPPPTASEPTLPP
jgi:hypothetical protein